MQQAPTDALPKALAPIYGKRRDRVTDRRVKTWSFRFRDRLGCCSAQLWGDFGTALAARRVHLGLRRALLTAARIGEVAGVRKSELQAMDDPSRAAWLIPAGRSKKKRARLVPLSTAARKIFLDLTTTTTTDILFPSPREPSTPFECPGIRVGAQPVHSATDGRGGRR